MLETASGDAGPVDWQSYDAYAAGRPHTVSGEVRVWAQAYSPQLDNTRDILVYLPPGYHTSEQRYPVVYFQDGQNVFDAATSYAGVEWGADETLQALSGEGVAAMAVAVPNAGERRLNEYTPPENPWWPGTGDRYVDFLIETVKPQIDRTFRTQADRRHTAIVGSSLGALISLYAWARRPDVFGLCGALSPALWVGRGLIYDIVAEAPRRAGRVYVDNGTLEASAHRLVEALHERGYREGEDLQVVVDEGGRHTEADWARRLPDALRFLLK